MRRHSSETKTSGEAHKVHKIIFNQHSSNVPVKYACEVVQAGILRNVPASCAPLCMAHFTCSHKFIGLFKGVNWTHLCLTNRCTTVKLAAAQQIPPPQHPPAGSEASVASHHSSYINAGNICGKFDFLPRSKNMCVRFRADSKLPVGISVWLFVYMWSLEAQASLVKEIFYLNWTNLVK